MISNAGLTKDFWIEMISITCYIVKRSPSATLDFKTPEKVWLGTSANYSDLKVFGCLAYMYVNDEKLKSRVKKDILLLE